MRSVLALGLLAAVAAFVAPTAAAQSSVVLQVVVGEPTDWVVPVGVTGDVVLDGDDAAALRRTVDSDGDGTVSDGEAAAFTEWTARASPHGRPVVVSLGGRHGTPSGTSASVDGLAGPVGSAAGITWSFGWTAHIEQESGPTSTLVISWTGIPSPYRLIVALYPGTALEVAPLQDVDGNGLRLEGERPASELTLVRFAPREVRYLEESQYEFMSTTSVVERILRHLTAEDSHATRRGTDLDGNGEVSASEAEAVRAAMQNAPFDPSPLRLGGAAPRSAERQVWAATPLEGPVAGGPAMTVVEEFVLRFDDPGVPSVVELARPGPFHMHAPRDLAFRVLSGIREPGGAEDGSILTGTIERVGRIEIVPLGLAGTPWEEERDAGTGTDAGATDAGSGAGDGSGATTRGSTGAGADGATSDNGHASSTGGDPSVGATGADASTKRTPPAGLLVSLACASLAAAARRRGA